MREITISTLTGKTLYAKIYYNNNGVITQRGSDVLLSEQPTGSGIYSNPLTISGLQEGDDILVFDAETDVKIGAAEYTPALESDATTSRTIDLVLEYESGHTGRCDIYRMNTVIQSHNLTDIGNDIYVGRSDLLEPDVYTIKYYIDNALVDFYNQIVQGGLILASDDTTYVSVTSANDYFNQRLRTTEWTLASTEDKLKALIQATSILDDLNYITPGATPDHAFPQQGSTTVPTNILKACCEIANALIKGVDPDMEVMSSNITETKIDGASVKMNGKTFAHFQYGVPSVLAWRYLVPYLKIGADIKLERIDL